MTEAPTRRQWLQAVGLGLGAIAVRGASAQSSETRRPNVLFIAIDDLNDWVGALGGHPQTLTPHIDALAKRGVVFRRAYCQAPACNPSRASVMTGLRPTTSGVYNNNHVWRDALPTAVTLPKHFMLHGYEVLGGGKVFHSSQNDSASWEYYFNFPGFLHPALTPANKLHRGNFDWGAVQADDEQTADTQLAEWAGDYLRQEHSKPFFLGCGFYRPHLPWYAPEKYFEKFPEAKTTLPPHLEGDLDDTPVSARRGGRDHDNVTSSGQWKRAVSAYLACIHYTDANVGRLIQALDQGPHADNTIVVLWSDHGWQLGEKQQWRKFTLWERSCRVALMLAGPGVTDRGAECDRTVELLDIYPTLVELAGLPERPELDGRSLRPLLADARASWDKPAITSNGPDKISVRTERWRYSRFPDGEELYDHESDPNEWDNLADDPQWATVMQSLAKLLPQGVSRKKIKNWNELSAKEKNIQPLPPGYHHGSDANNVVGLDQGPRVEP